MLRRRTCWSGRLDFNARYFSALHLTDKFNRQCAISNSHGLGLLQRSVQTTRFGVYINIRKHNTFFHRDIENTAAGPLDVFIILAPEQRHLICSFRNWNVILELHTCWAFPPVSAIKLLVGSPVNNLAVACIRLGTRVEVGIILPHCTINVSE